MPGGVLGSLEGVEHQASHSYQCLNSLFLLLRHVSGVYVNGLNTEPHIRFST